jgi:predicted nucleotidyltransferase
VDDAHDGPYAREPQIEDLVRICRALNDAGARYLLIGGFAVIAHGGARTTKDIDLLVDASPENVARVKQGLRILEDRAVDDVADTDMRNDGTQEASRPESWRSSPFDRARSWSTFNDPTPNGPTIQGDPLEHAG